MPLWFVELAFGAFYLNGVQISPDQARQVHLDAAEVVVDASGDLQIRTSAWKVSGGQVVPADTPDTPGGWWLVIEDQHSSGLRATVRINGVLVQTVSSGSSAVMTPLGSIAHPGLNDVRIEVASNLGRGRMAVSVGKLVQRAGLPVMDGSPTRWVVGAETASAPWTARFEITAL
jgi:hypothetical protein